jgi:hypothetical protein
MFWPSPGKDVRGVPFAARRQLLEELAREWSPLALSPTTTDPELAKTWLKDLPGTGIGGLVLRGGSQIYDALLVPPMQWKVLSGLRLEDRPVTACLQKLRGPDRSGMPGPAKLARGTSHCPRQ